MILVAVGNLCANVVVVKRRETSDENSKSKHVLPMVRSSAGFVLLCKHFGVRVLLRKTHLMRREKTRVMHIIFVDDRCCGTFIS